MKTNPFTYRRGSMSKSLSEFVAVFIIVTYVQAFPLELALLELSFKAEALSLLYWSLS